MESQTTTVELHGMAHGGEAVGRLEDGRAVFVAGGIPGETVEIRITREKKRWARAEVVSVIEASPERVEPPCPFVGDCGGCQWQHIAIGRQRELKRDIILGQLAHLAGLEDVSVSETVGVGEPDGFGYRNHVHLAVDDTGMTGYYRAGTREVVPVDSCRLLHALLREWQEQLPESEIGKELDRIAALLTGYMDANVPDHAPILYATHLWNNYMTRG